MSVSFHLPQKWSHITENVLRDGSIFQQSIHTAPLQTLIQKVRVYKFLKFQGYVWSYHPKSQKCLSFRKAVEGGRKGSNTGKRLQGKIIHHWWGLCPKLEMGLLCYTFLTHHFQLSSPRNLRGGGYIFYFPVQISN